MTLSKRWLAVILLFLCAAVLAVPAFFLSGLSPASGQGQEQTDARGRAGDPSMVSSSVPQVTDEPSAGLVKPKTPAFLMPAFDGNRPEGQRWRILNRGWGEYDIPDTGQATDDYTVKVMREVE